MQVAIIYSDLLLLKFTRISYPILLSSKKEQIALISF